MLMSLNDWSTVVVFSKISFTQCHLRAMFSSDYTSFFRVLLALTLLIATVTARDVAAQTASFERPPIDYLNAPVTDPVAKLIAKIESGESQLTYDDEHGYLAAILEALQVPVSSQTLVFSKTSLQLHRITPRRPRALYFNDDVYVGWCQRGDVVEIASTDPQLGAVFYTVKQTPPKRLQESGSTSAAASKSQSQPAQNTAALRATDIVRDRGQCLTCHASSRTQGVPGYLVRSVFADASGQPKFGSGTFTIDHTSPLKQRWGGWYVTGRHGDSRHMGNVFAQGDASEHNFDYESGANLTSLNELVKTQPYLTPHSDIVALMVLEHQTQMHNAITAANFETRQAIHQSYQMNALLEREPDHVSESAQRRLQSAADNVTRYLFLCDEAELTDPISGTSGYAEEFAAAGPSDSQGRSLRMLDLKTRLFRYPCSYLVYSESFDGLPDRVRAAVLDRMIDVLAGTTDTDEYRHLTAADRTAIREILIETKPEFASRLASRSNG